LHVFDPNETATAPFVERGAHRQGAAQAVVDAARIVLVCLPNGA
jgi:hypothetical protein